MRLFFACIFVFAGTLGAFAERREALVFGANNYVALRQLKNADSDAEVMKATLEKLGFKVTLEEDRDLKHMRRALADFGEDAKGADVALIFYSGHGIEIAGGNRLVPVDADASSPDTLKASTLPLEEVRDVVAVTSKIGLIVLDACRDDPFSSTGSGRGAAPLKPGVTDAVHAGFGRMGRSENILFAFSAAPGQSASDGSGGNSPFTAALSKYLGTDGLEIRSVLTLVQQAVYEETRGKQLPYVESGLPQTFFASTTREQLPERERLLLAMADVTPDIRGEVERIAAGEDMPLAPLYGALVAADLTSLSSDDRDKKLKDAAQTFVRTRDELKRLSSSDPQVSQLRAQAETSLSLGAFMEARQALAKAIAVDAKAGDALAGNLVKRRLSEAATHVSDAGVARAQLDYASAIVAMETAAALHSRVEAEDVPDAARGDRDRLLIELGDLHILMGNTAAALDAYRRMLDASQLRVAKAPLMSDAERDVAAAHQRIGEVKMAHGDLLGASESFQADLAVSRKLAASDPGNVALQRDLEVAYVNVGDGNVAQGDSNGALSAFQAGVVIARALARSDQGNNSWQRDLAVSLTRVGDVKMVQGDFSGALLVYRDGVSIAERLAENNPGNPEWEQYFGFGQEKIGDANMALGDSAAALVAYEADLASAIRVATTNPVHTGWQRDVSIAQNKIGDVKTAQGDLSGALEAHKASLAIAMRLVAVDPNNAVWRRDLAASQQRVGDVKRAQGDGDGALAAYQAALDSGKSLVERDPGNLGWLRDLALAQQRIGDVKLAQSEFAGALSAYQAEVQIAETLVARDASNRTWQRDLLVARQRVGDLKLAQGDSDGALASYRDSLLITRKLAASDPGNTQWQRELSLGQEKVGDAAMAEGDFAIALAAFQDSVAISRQLSKSDPKNMGWRRAEAVTEARIADAKMATGDIPGAVESAQSYLDISVELAAGNPSNIGFQRDVLVAHFKVAQAGHEPRKHLNAALDIALAMQRRGVLSAMDAAIPDTIRDELASLPDSE